MALDEALFSLFREDLPTIRFYTWSPAALSIGYFQPLDSLRAANLPAVPVVRRLTGGDAVYHSGDLSYSLVCAPRGKKTLETLNACLARGLARGLGVPLNLRGGGEKRSGPLCLESSSKYDLLSEGRKVGGAAFRKRAGVVLQQGFIILEDAARHKPALSSLAGFRVTPEQAAREMISGLAEDFVPRDLPLSDAESKLALELAETKYNSDSWLRRR